MDLQWLLIGIIAGSLTGLAVGALVTRRLWRNMRRMSARTKGREQLVELGQLAGGLAHEIKNPLSTINVNLELLAEDLARFDNPQQHRFLNRLHSVQDETARLKRILEDFLQYAGRVEMGTERVDLRTLIAQLVDFFEAQTDTSHVILRTTVPQEPAIADVDPKLIKQALLNLMINAVQAMTQGGELLVKLTVRRGQAMIEVIDTGSGISDEELARIFEVYYSTKTGGSGLGLPTTRRIIREHHGQLTVESELGKGTRFIITLPLAL